MAYQQVRERLSMMKMNIGNDRLLIVDFEGLLSPRKEAAIACRMAGKSRVETSEELGVSEETVKSQCNDAYEVLGVKGQANPLQLLTILCFERGFAKFAAWVLTMVTTFLSGPSNNHLQQHQNIAWTRNAQARRASRKESGLSLTGIVYSISNNTLLAG